MEDFNDKCRLVAKGSRIGRMFTLDAGILAMNATMYAKGKGVVADIDIWHKHIGHANVQRLKLMQSYWEFITRNEVEPVLPNAPNQQEM